MPNDDNIISAVTGGGAASVGNTGSDVVKSVATGGAKSVTGSVTGNIGGDMSATGLIVSAIIGAVVSGVSTAAGAVVDKNMAEDANNRSMKIYKQQRADEEKMRKENTKLAKWDRRFQQQQFQFGKQMKQEEMKMAKDTTAFNKRQTQMQNTLATINSIPQVRSTFVEMFNRRKAA